MRVEEIVKDLFSLEVNLIESRDITGRKMESASVGMAQIANKYAVYLTDDLFTSCLASGLPAGTYSLGVAPTELTTYRQLVHGIVSQSDSDYSKATFEDLATVAEHVIEAGDFGDHAEELGVVVRIRGVSQQLRFVADRWAEGTTFIGRNADGTDRKDPESLTPADRLQIRKAWEVGTNVLVMQTVTQLDGDSVTRISSDRLARGDGPAPPNRPGRPPSDPDLLFQLHRQLMDTALHNWRNLFETVALLVGRAASALFT